MVKKEEIYQCRNCGAKSRQWLGQCPGCGEWNTLEQYVEIKKPPALSAQNMDGARILAETPDNLADPFSCGVVALDRILGGGLVPGSSILLGGEPGIGKSTLLLQLCAAVARKGLKVLYASGEESLGQIRNRAERLDALEPTLLGIASTHVEEVEEAIEKNRPALVIADSAQTIGSAEVEGLPGNVNQTRAVATKLVELCRNLGATLVLVGHVTKDGTLAGPRLLEHLVDTVLALEGDRRQMFRLLRVFKNRFGPNDELLVFRMESHGLEIVADPSTFFLEERDARLSGTALVMACDGQRPLAVEIQALVTRSFLSIPRRAALGFNVNRLNLLLAVLEKRLKLNFSQADIYAKIGGGISLQEPGMDLGLVAAILSSYYDLALPEKAIFWGEIDLNGQIRPVSLQKMRMEQARRLGFAPICGNNEFAKSSVASVMDLQKRLFKRG